MPPSLKRVDDDQNVVNMKDFKEGELKKMSINGADILFVRVKDKIYAMDAICSHEGGPLEDGTLTGFELKCPWHYAVFDVRTGKVSDQTTWATDLNSYPLKIDESTGNVSVKLDQIRQEHALQKKKQDKEKTAEELENEKRFYEAEERKAATKEYLELLQKESLEGTDIMTFRISRGHMDYIAGQFAYFKIKGLTGDPKGPVRHFSIASSPTEKRFLLISTRIRDTPYKQSLSSLELGTGIETWGPQGEFNLHKDHSRTAIFLSGGIGVTPFRSMVKYASDSQLPLRIIMFDSNRNEENILYRDQFDSWTSENKNFRIIYTITDEPSSTWVGEKGKIDKDMINRNVDKEILDNAIFYICGPPGMLLAMKDLLAKELRIPDGRIKAEEFTGY